MSSDSSAGTLPDRAGVVVVGAGPTGLSLACVLAARGVSCVVLDQAAEHGNTSRAAVVHARTLEVLEDLGVTDDLVRRGVAVPRFTVRDRDRALLTVGFDRLPTRYPYTLMVPQDVTEGVLAERLHAVGGSVYRQHAVTGVETDTAGATVVVTGPGGAVRRVRAGYVVGCDGMRSTVREQAGIGFTGGRYAQSFLLADVRMDWPFARDEVHLFFSPSGLVVVAPLPGDRFRVVATLDEAPRHPDVAHVQALLDARGPVTEPATVRERVWGSRFSVHHRLAEAYRRGPVFLAGDAAHVHSPAGGQGMNLGIRDGVALGGLLADVLDGRAGQERLDRYEASRRPVARSVVAMTDRLTRAATAKRPVTRVVRNTALRLAGRSAAVRQKLAMDLSGLGTDLARAGTAERAPSSHTSG